MTDQQLATVPRRRIAGERARPVPGRRPGTVTATGPAPAPRSAPAAGPGARRLRAPRVPGWLLVGLAVTAVAAVVLDLVLWGRTASASDAVSAAPSSAEVFSGAPAAAEQAAEAILSYDYGNLADDTAEARALMTPEYGQTFQNTVDDLLDDAATASRGKVRATVTASGVAGAEGDTVEVLLFVDQTSTTAADDRPQTALNRVLLTMVRSGDGWLVDDVAAL